ncbi:MAG: hypothetical protein K1W21_10075, partial [Oscillospiraceae bacterium]
GPPSLRLLFWRKQILDPIPLFFADFMSFHVLYFIISALYTQSLSFKTDFSTIAKVFASNTYLKKGTYRKPVKKNTPYSRPLQPVAPRQMREGLPCNPAQADVR